MKPGKRIICFALLTLFTPAFLPGAQKSTRIADSGTTVIKGDFPRGKVVVKILTATLEGGCAKNCPATRWVLSGNRKKHVIVVSDIDIAVNGHSVDVPTLAYATIDAPNVARLLIVKGRFALKIYGNEDGAATGYFVLISFNQERVEEMKVYLQIDDRDPLNVTHFYKPPLFDQ